jgi:hypothetical protein
MTRSDLSFGFESNDLNVLHEMVRSRLSIEFEERYSDYLGGDYLFGVHEGEEIRLVLNIDGDEVAEEEYAHLGSLIQIDGTSSGDDWKRWANEVGLTLIRENAY